MYPVAFDDDLPDMEIAFAVVAATFAYCITTACAVFIASNKSARRQRRGRKLQPWSVDGGFSAASGF
jgi:hypothetical protein